MKTLGIIGCGAMGSAIAQSLQGSVLLYDSDVEKARSLEKQGERTAVPSLQELMKMSDCLLIAVKPQILATLYDELRELGSADKSWISIAAGVSLETLSEKLGTDEVVRFMPNIAAQLQASVTAIASLARCSKEHLSYAQQVAQSFGSAFIIPESQFGAFIGISGSAIAFILEFYHALAMGGVAQGIAYPTSLHIALETAKSAANLVASTGKHPMELATTVCSAGGTTIEGMLALAEGGFDATVMQAVRKASEKSSKLEALAKDAKR
ncbi:MAG: pyrroline-5-carboxylate reductase [Sphaerochaeta sp.]|nr:pyrroline-5-carboxylate reductase [Sphaerochaeta sp.]